MIAMIEEKLLGEKEMEICLKIARDSISDFVIHGKKSDYAGDEARLFESGAAFVTLNIQGRLRGCIGHVVASLPLWECVREMAIAAATQDPRFPKMQKSEMGDLELEISVLTPPREMSNTEDIEVGKHGLIISKGYFSGLLLPQVPVEWDWDRDMFLEQTCVKAGLPEDAWRDSDTKIESFQAQVFS